MAYGPAYLLPGDRQRIATDPSTEPFWEAAKERRLTACQCGNCGQFRLPPTPFCPNCQSTEKQWPTLSGMGTIFSFAICTHSPFPDAEDQVYVPVIVDLDDAPGARLVTNIHKIDADDVEIGMKVAVDWDPIQDGWLLPVFTPAA